MDLGITSKGGGVIRVMSGGRSMNQESEKERKRSLQQVMQKKRKEDGMEWR